MKNIYNQRLQRFADHLAKIKNHLEEGLFETVTLVALEEHRSIYYEVKYHHWVFEELPVCFDEWGYSGKYGNPLWEETDQEKGTVTSVIDFFNLKLEEFTHLFDINGFQNVFSFGGDKLNEMSDGSAIARNIVEIINRRMEEV